MLKTRDHRPLENRVYRYKNPSMVFYCPLCRTKRAFVYSPKVLLGNWMYIFIITAFLSAALYPFMEFRSLISFFLVWGVMEYMKRHLFKQEIPCPHCGFDATWYHKDVKVARELVKNFWDLKSKKVESEATISGHS